MFEGIYHDSLRANCVSVAIDRPRNYVPCSGLPACGPDLVSGNVDTLESVEDTAFNAASFWYARENFFDWLLS
jgi:hypothetical protein